MLDTSGTLPLESRSTRYFKPVDVSVNSVGAAPNLANRVHAITSPPSATRRQQRCEQASASNSHLTLRRGRPAVQDIPLDGELFNRPRTAICDGELPPCRSLAWQTTFHASEPI